MNFTLRVESDRVIVSRDDGASVILNDSLSQREAAELLDRFWSSRTATRSADTAGALAVCAEASMMRPSETGRGISWTGRPLGGDDRLALGSLVSSKSRPLRELLANRRSRRHLGPIGLEAIATILWRTSRVEVLGPVVDGVQVTQRPVPSAGGRHPHELVVASASIEQLGDSAWAFDPFTCELVRQEYLPEQVTAATSAVMEAGQLASTPGAVLFLRTDFSRTLSRYPAGAALVWRDSGVLLGALHLCAEDLGLSSCLVATSGVLQPRGESLWVDTGALALGSPPTS